MAILEQMQQDVVAALKAGDKKRTSALRMLVAELQRAQKEGGDDEITVLGRERKKRLESARAFGDAGRDELAAGEQAEADLIAAYLPEQLGDDDLRKLVEHTITELGVDSPRDIGKVMAAVMPQVKGKADGSRVSAMVKDSVPS